MVCLYSFDMFTPFYFHTIFFTLSYFLFSWHLPLASAMLGHLCISLILKIRCYFQRKKWRAESIKNLSKVIHLKQKKKEWEIHLHVCMQNCCTFHSTKLVQLKTWDSKHSVEVDFSNYALNLSNDISEIN